MAVCTMADIGLTITGEGAEPICDAISEYLSVFAKPVLHDGTTGGMLGNFDCLNCGERLDGFLGTFTWGIAHGEGKCSKCGWPCRAYHNPKDAEGDIFDRRLQIILQYHPSGVEMPEENN